VKARVEGRVYPIRRALLVPVGLCVLALLLASSSGVGKTVTLTAAQFKSKIEEIRSSTWADTINVITEEVKKLIKDLGDEKWKTRRIAKRALVEVIKKGNKKTREATLQLVRVAKKSTDLEVSWRALVILRRAIRAVSKDVFPTLYAMSNLLDDQRLILQNAFNEYQIKLLAAELRGDPPQVLAAIEAARDAVGALRRDVSGIRIKELRTFSEFGTLSAVQVRFLKFQNSIQASTVLTDETKALINRKISEFKKHLELDEDKDGLPSVWEELYGTDPKAADAAKDPDNDKLTNAQEYAKGTLPTSADSDGDGSNDNIDKFPLDPEKK